MIFPVEPPFAAGQQSGQAARPYFSGSLKGCLKQSEQNTKS
ncbi:hypothetical protein [Eikenella corrodens]|nr:hypothetical protein [Eikenella corrodens]